VFLLSEAVYTEAEAVYVRFLPIFTQPEDFPVKAGLNNSVFRDITPYKPLEVNRSFGGKCRLYLQGWRVSQTRIYHEAGNKLAFRAYSSILMMDATGSPEMPVVFALHTLQPWRWRRYVPPKRHLTLNGLHRDTPEDRTLHNHRCENLRSYTALYRRR
jgi:hypothetical protein